jgi:hypothetical protein
MTTHIKYELQSSYLLAGITTFTQESINSGVHTFLNMDSKLARASTRRRDRASHAMDYHTTLRWRDGGRSLDSHEPDVLTHACVYVYMF